MLVAKKVFCAEHLAGMLIRVIHPYPQEIDDVPFIQETKTDTNKRQFFCYEHQFSVEIEESAIEFKIYIDWHCGYEKADIARMESAIADLHNIFKKA